MTPILRFFPNVFVLGVSLTLAACGLRPGGQPDPSPTLEPVATVSPSPIVTPLPTLTPGLISPYDGRVEIWTSWSPQAVQALAERIELFQSIHPDVEFEIEFHQAQLMKSDFELAWSEGEAPSVLFGPSAWGPELYSRGFVRNVSRLASPDLEAGLHPLAWSQVSQNGLLLGLPLQMDGIVLYRNRELVPSPVRTVSEWIERAETPIDGVMIESALNLSFLHAGAQAHACGGSILEEQLSPAFDGPLGICWLRFIQHLGETGDVSLASDEALNDFLNGRAGWYFGSSERIEFLENELGADTVVVDPWPIYSVTGSRMAGYVWTENAFFSSEASSNDLAAAWAFVGSLLEVEDQLYFSEVGHGSLQPVRIGVEPVDPRMAEVRVVLEGGMALPFLDGKEALIEVLERAVRAVTVLGTDPELALERALLELDELEAED